MNSTQNKKIEQVKETTMIVGIDVGSEKHYFRAFNWRGIELTRKPVPFSNSMEGFNSFYNTIVELMQKSELESKKYEANLDCRNLGKPVKDIFLSAEIQFILAEYPYNNNCGIPQIQLEVVDSSTGKTISSWLSLSCFIADRVQHQGRAESSNHRFQWDWEIHIIKDTYWTNSFHAWNVSVFGTGKNRVL